MDDANLPRVEGYQLLGLLGHGGMGGVWRALDLSTHRMVALKLLAGSAFGSAKAKARFEREVELSARLNHPGIARIYHSGLHAGQHFFAMELVDGVHLDRFVRERRLSQRQTVELMLRVAQAVHHAHQRGVIHRDLKPSNILVTADGSPRVLDFGLAKDLVGSRVRPAVSMAGDTLGTIGYMAPEQARGDDAQVDTRSDVYSLGAVFLELLTGQLPHEPKGTKLEQLNRVIEEEPRRPRTLDSSLDRDLEAILEKAIAREPAGRYATAGEFASDLDRYLRREPLAARPLTLTYFLGKWVRRHRVGFAIAAAFVVAVVAIATVAYVRVTRARDAAQRSEHEAQRALYVNQIRLAAAEIDANRTVNALAALDACRPEFRGWEWGRLRYQADQCVLRVGGRDASRDAVFTDGGNCVTVVEADGDVAVWDSRTGQLLRTQHLNIEGSTFRPRLSPDGSRVLLGNEGGMELWNVAGAVREWTCDAGARIHRVAFSTDGVFVIAVVGEEVRIWNAATGEQTASHPAGSEVLSLVAGRPPVQALWSTHSTIGVARGNAFLSLPLPGHSPIGNSSKGDVIALTPEHRVVRISHANPLDRKVLLHLPSDARNIELDESANHLVCGESSGVVRYWDLTRRSRERRFYGAAPGRIIWDSASDRFAVVEFPRVSLWDIRQHAEGIRPWLDAVSPGLIAVSADGERAVLSDRNDLRLVNRDGDTVWTQAVSHPVRVSLARDDTRVIVVTRHGEVQVRDVATGHSLDMWSTGVGSIAWASTLADGRWLATPSSDGIRVWDIQSHRSPASIPADGLSVFASDSSVLWAVLSDKNSPSVGEWDCSEWKLRRVFTADAGDILNIVGADAQGRLVAAATPRGRVYLWSRLDSRLIARFDAGDGNLLRSLAFSADGRRLFTAGKTIKVWDTARGLEVIDLGSASFPNPGVIVTAGDRVFVRGSRGLAELLTTESGH